MQINDCEFRGADRIRQARVDRTQEAVHRVEDWALRLVRNTLEIPTMVESLTAARAEIDAILRDERYRRAGGVFIEGEMTADDRENRARQLTIAACRIVDALALAMLQPAPRHRKSRSVT